MGVKENVKADNKGLSQPTNEEIREKGTRMNERNSQT